MLIAVPLKVAAMCVQFSPIGVVELTVCHFMPSKTENVAILVGGMMLLIERANWFSLLIIVNTGEPWL